MQQRLVDLMTNRAMLDVNQLYAGFAGDRIWSKATGMELWAKPLPGAAIGVVLFNRNGTTGCHSQSRQTIEVPCDDDPALVAAGQQEITFEFVGLPSSWLGLATPPTELHGVISCNISNIFPATASNASGPAQAKNLGRFTGRFTAMVPPHGVVFVRVSGCIAQPN